MKRPIGYGPSFVVLVTTAVVLVAGPAAIRRITYASSEAQIIQASQRLDDDTILERMNQAYRDIATIVEPSVVHISTEHLLRDRWGNERTKTSSGSGWIYDADGHIVTNYHVIEDAADIEVQLHNGEMREAEIVGSDPLTDVAVIKIGAGQLHPATRRTDDSYEVRQGDMVFAFGSPFDFRFSMSSGIVSGKGRSVGVIRNERGQQYGYENFIQVDAAINPGNSGGPLTDHRGHVIGMNTAIATGPRSGNSYEEGQFAGIGLAIPIEMIEPVVTQLIENGVVAKGYLGVTVVDRDRPVSEELGMLDFSGYGLLVAGIPAGSPGPRHGLRQGDVIKRLADTSISTIAQFRSAVQFVNEDDLVELEVWRFDDERDRGRARRITMPGRDARQLANLLLLGTDDTIGDLMDDMGFTGRAVRVTRLMPEGPARAAGLKRGDLITHVNRRPVGTVRQLQSVISSIMPGQTAQLTVWRYDPETARAEQTDIPVTLVRLNSARASGRVNPADQWSLESLGIGAMETATPELAEEREVQFHPGVMLLDVKPESSLAEAGVTAGSTIVEVAERPVDGVESFIRALSVFDIRRGVKVTVVLPDGETTKPRLQLD